MVTVDEIQRLLLTGADVVGADGRKIGSVGQLFLDAQSGEPAWVTVTTGLFGRGESFVPLAGAVAGDRELQVGYDKDRVKHAPRIEGSEGSLSPDEERELFRHYGLGPTSDDDDRSGQDRVEDDRSDVRPVDDDRDAHHGPADASEHAPRHVAPPVVGGTGADPVDVDEARREDLDRDRLDRDDVRHDDEAIGATAAGAAATGLAATGGATDEGMVLRAERAKVIGTERVPTERVRLRRYTVTENRTISVPVSREEYRIEYDPADEPAGAAEPTVPADDDHPDGPRHRR